MSSQISRSVLKAVAAVEKMEGVGAVVRRSIGTSQLRSLSPFLMLDHFNVGEGAGFPDHPHRGMSTVTLLLDGAFEHEDFAGNRGMLHPGDLQWMIAGRGIVHAEMPVHTKGGPNPVGLQLWIDLPSEHKMMEPAYYEHKKEEIVTVSPADGVSIKVIAGESHGAVGKVQKNFDCLYLDVTLEHADGQSSVPIDIPEGWTAFFYTLDGAVSVAGKSYPPYTTVVLTAAPGETKVDLISAHTAGQPATRLVLIAGKPLAQKVVQHGPFVMDSTDGIYQAFEDYQGSKNGFERARGFASEIGKRMSS